MVPWCLKQWCAKWLQKWGYDIWNLVEKHIAHTWAGSHISLLAHPSTVPYNAMQVAITMKQTCPEGSYNKGAKQKSSQYHILSQKYNWVVNAEGKFSLIFLTSSSLLVCMVTERWLRRFMWKPEQIQEYVVYTMQRELARQLLFVLMDGLWLMLQMQWSLSENIALLWPWSHYFCFELTIQHFWSHLNVENTAPLFF